MLAAAMTGFAGRPLGVVEDRHRIDNLIVGQGQDGLVDDHDGQFTAVDRQTWQRRCSVRSSGRFTRRQF